MFDDCWDEKILEKEVRRVAASMVEECPAANMVEDHSGWMIGHARRWRW